MNELQGHALNWLRQHHDQHLGGDRMRLVTRCGEYLIERFEVSRSTADTAALHAIADVERGASGWRIDALRTTSDILFLFHPTSGQTKVFLTSDIPDDAAYWPAGGDLSKQLG